MLLRNGTTSVVNITCDPSLVDDREPMPLRTWWCPELIDLTWTEESARMASTAAEWVEAHPPCGVSPHAPYTVSDGLYQLVAKQARDRGWLLTTHAAESREEDEMWRWSRGPMFDRYRRGGEGGAVRHLANLGVLGRNCLLAHANYLSDDEAGLIVRSGASVVHCPRTHAFFGRPPAPLAQWQRHGIHVCLGTDSMASNDRLDMFAEMRELIRAWPGVSPETALRMATVNGAAALNREGQLGCLAVGAVADLVAVPVGAEVADPYESVVYSGASLSYAMIGGKEIQHEQHR
jgi:cytosine/adenosine deaminase-related metal-dependent hydrolase